MGNGIFLKRLNNILSTPFGVNDKLINYELQNNYLFNFFFFLQSNYF